MGQTRARPGFYNATATRGGPRWGQESPKCSRMITHPSDFTRCVKPIRRILFIRLVVVCQIVGGDAQGAG